MSIYRYVQARRLRLSIMEWYTANILLVMRAPQNGNCQPSEDSSLYSKYMAVQAYLDRYNAEMKVKQEGGVETGLTEGETTSNPTTESEVKSETSGTSENEQIVLAGPKGRSRYAPEDRERIRRERNRIHAKRTRDRRKKFMEDSEKVGRLQSDKIDDSLVIMTYYDQMGMMSDSDGSELRCLMIWLASCLVTSNRC